jgi:hypothetical protein
LGVLKGFGVLVVVEGECPIEPNDMENVALAVADHGGFCAESEGEQIYIRLKMRWDRRFDGFLGFSGGRKFLADFAFRIGSLRRHSDGLGLDQLGFEERLHERFGNDATAATG